MGKTMVVLGLVLLVPITWLSINWYMKEVAFKNGCSGHLQRAAMANTVGTAAEELGVALDYLDDQGLTQGSTAFIITLPKNDIGFWYKNLQASYDELLTVPADATPLETSNVLMKLRETLMDDGEEGSYVTVPPNIEVYPMQGGYLIMLWIFLVLGLAGLFLFIGGIFDW